MTKWQPLRDPVGLIEALSEEILAATNAEVQRASVLQGRTIASIAREVRGVIKAARADVDADPAQDLNEHPTGDANQNMGEPGGGARPAGAVRRPLYHQRH